MFRLFTKASLSGGRSSILRVLRRLLRLDQSEDGVRGSEPGPEAGLHRVPRPLEAEGLLRPLAEPQQRLRSEQRNTQHFGRVHDELGTVEALFPPPLFISM